MKFTSKTEHAFIIIKELKANRGSVVPMYYIANKYNKSLHFIEQVQRNLKQAGLIGSKKGPNGGSYIIPEKVTVSDILKACNDKPEFIFNQNFELNNKIEAVFNSMEV